MRAFDLHAGLRQIVRPGSIRAGLVLYGAAFALYGVLHLSSALPNEETLMGTRTDGVSASIAVLDRGGPPLLGARVPYGSPGAKPATDYYPVGVTDDQGLYLYLPVLGWATGQHDPHLLLKWFFIGCFALLFALYPLLFYEFTGSALAAIAAPILVLHSFAFLRDTDLYWIVGWCVLLGLPLVFVALKREWGKLSFALLVCAGLVASFATSIRIHSGLPVTIAAVVVALVRAPTLRVRALTTGAIVAASFLISVGLLDAVRIARDETIGVAFRSEYPSEHPTWHNAYIGLGFLPNKYGIAWDDSVAVTAVHKADPHAGYLTGEYERTLRHLYFEIFRHDPWFVLGTFWTKFGVCLHSAIRQFGWLWVFLLTLPLLLGRRRRDMRWFLALSVPALAFTIVPPILTVPFPQYEAGWLAAVGFVWLLLVTWALASLPDAVRWFRQEHRPWRSIVPSRRALTAAALSCLALVGVAWPAITHADAALARGQALEEAGAHGDFVTHLSLDTPRIVPIILTNWSPPALGSQWRIRAVQLPRLPR